MRWWNVILRLVLVLATGVARAGPLEAINAARDDACLRTAPAHDLVESRNLDLAALRLASGRTLHDVLGTLPERPAFAAAVLLAGATSDEAIRRLAAARFCRDLASPDLREVGYARVPAGLWVLVAAPLAVPGERDRVAAATLILDRVNAARAAGRRCGGVYYPRAAPVRGAPELNEVAYGHSLDMSRRDWLTHDGTDGSVAADRVRRAGLAVRHVGENIASGVPTAAEVVDGWLASPSHCATVMDARFTRMGVDFATAPYSRGVIYWTQVFTEPR